MYNNDMKYGDWINWVRDVFMIHNPNVMEWYGLDFIITFMNKIHKKNIFDYHNHNDKDLQYQ